MAIPRKQYSIEVGSKTLTLEISSIAEQANAAVLAKYGETVVLTTVVMSKSNTNANYLPLKVDYEERFYAAGKIIGSRFIRREGRPSEEAILAGRLVDRIIRPLFDERLRRDIQVVVTVLAIDEENEPDFAGLMAASTCLAISDIPWQGPVAGVRVAKIGDRFLINPQNSELKNPDLSFETFVAGPEGGINMIELGGNDADGKEIMDAFKLAQKEIDKLIVFERQIIKEIGKPKTKTVLFEPDPELCAAVQKFLSTRLEEAVYQPNKMEQVSRLGALKDELTLHLREQFVSAGGNPDATVIEFLFNEAVGSLVCKNILEHNRRPDGRGLNEVRELNGEVGLFLRTHGSALFTRGNTQALAVTTLAPPGAEQLIETMETTGKRRFMLHYNFPPYSVGEIGSFRGPGRREIGHGALAGKALRPLIPPQEQFPYTIRVVSEVLSSNGSSSMAAVCASSLSLMDAGVPIKKPAAGIAMGLIMEKFPMTNNQSPKYKILTDIQGPEDHYGNMDLKAAGTKDGINAIQMDVKTDGITTEIIDKALVQAREAHLQILKFMEGVLPAPRPKLSPYVPTILQTKISPEKIGTLIGPGGKVINGLIRKWELTSIDVEDDGRVFVSAPDPKKAQEAMQEIKMLTREFKVGEIVGGRIVKVLDFGAIVDLGGGQDGMIHVSELKEGYVKNVGDVVRMGDFVEAKVIRVDEDGKIGLSLKQAE
jgi:polyribonucleotide nucleotidyltransferase